MSTLDDNLERDLRSQPLTILVLIGAIVIFAGGMIFVALTFPRSIGAWSIWAMSSAGTFMVIWKTYRREERENVAEVGRRKAWRILHISSGIAIGLTFAVLAVGLSTHSVTLLNSGQILVGLSSLILLRSITKRLLES